MERYNRSEAARFLGISRRTFYNWIGSSIQPTFTKRELEKLAAKHAKKPTIMTTLEALQTEVAALRADNEKLRSRIENLEQRLKASADESADKTPERPREESVNPFASPPTS